MTRDHLLRESILNSPGLVGIQPYYQFLLIKKYTVNALNYIVLK